MKSEVLFWRSGDTLLSHDEAFKVSCFPFLLESLELRCAVAAPNRKLGCVLISKCCDQGNQDLAEFFSLRGSSRTVRHSQISQALHL